MLHGIIHHADWMLITRKLCRFENRRNDGSFAKLQQPWQHTSTNIISENLPIMLDIFVILDPEVQR